MKSLARGKPNAYLRQQRLLRGWSLQHVADELRTLCEKEGQTAGVTADMVGKWERGENKPGPFYREKLCRLYGLPADQLGFIDTSMPVYPEEAYQPQSAQVSHDDNRGTQPATSNAALSPPAISVSQGHVTIRDVPGRQSFPLSDASVAHEPGPQDMDRSRRKFLEETPSIIGTVILIPSYDLLNSPLLERLSRALTKPSSIDEKTLRYLEQRTGSYWRDRNDAVLASYDLLSYVLEHLQKVLFFLEGSLLPTVRTRLCSIAGETAMLAGELFFDISDYMHAREFHKAAVRAAQEGSNHALEAVAWGRMSFAWTYSGNAQEALTCIQEARRLAARSVNATVQAWLAAVEAEIRANLGDSELCLEALEGAECVEDKQHPKEDCYWIHFDRSLLAGYQGICFLRLSRLEDAQSLYFLGSSQRALENALMLLNPALMRRRPTLLTDLAGTYVQQGEFEEACLHALQATKMVAQIKSPIVFQRLLTLRHRLEVWKDTQYVKNLDEYLVPLLTSGWYQGNT